MMEQPVCIFCGNPATEATYIGYLCKSHFKTLPEVCDFCIGEEPTWIYPATDFPMPYPPGHYSRGEWLACDACHDLIESGQWEQLADRAVSNGNREADAETAVVLKAALLNCHQRFAAHRTVPAIRIGSA